MALCLPRSSTAALSATCPTTWLSASRIYHLRSTCSALALKVFIGSRKLSHDARGVSKIFAGKMRRGGDRPTVAANPRLFRGLGLESAEFAGNLVVLRLQQHVLLDESGALFLEVFEC